MKKGLMIFIFINVFICSFVNAIPDFTINPGHPRIFINSENIDELRNRAETTHADTYSVIKQWCDDNWDDLAAQKKIYDIDKTGMVDAGELRYALIYALGEIPGQSYSNSINDYGQKAINIIMDRLGDSPSRENLRTVAITYDWVYPLLSTAQKQSIVDWFHSASGDTPFLCGYGGECQRCGYRITSTPKCLYPVLAFYGDGYKQDVAEIYLNLIKEDWFESLNAVFHMGGEDGGHAAGPVYTRLFYPRYYSIHQDFYALYTATDGTIEDFFGKYSYVTGFPNWFLNIVQPGPISPSPYSSDDIVPVIKLGDTASLSWNIEYDDLALMNTLRLFAHVAKQKGELEKAQLITWIIEDLLNMVPSDRTWEIIFNDRTINSKSPSDLGLSKSQVFGWKETEGKIDSYLDNPKSGVGEVYMRSSWEGLGSDETDTTYSFFKAPPYYYFGHQHFDSLAFSIWKGEPLVLLNTGAYYTKYEGGAIGSSHSSFPHHWYYYERTVSANTLLILDPDEAMSVQGFNHVFRDGGQRTLADTTYSWGDLIEGGLNDFGGLIKYEDNLDYTYSSGDATKAYNSIVDNKQYVTQDSSPKVSLVQRDFIYLKSSDGNNDYFVVFDRVDSTDPNFRKVFQLHTVGEPIMDGTVTHIFGDGNSGLWESGNTDSYRVSQTNSQLFMKTLIPFDTKAYKMGGVVSTTTTQYIDNLTGSILDGPKINISVSDSSIFSANPTVVIDGGTHPSFGEWREAFMCDGKNDDANTLNNCIRGGRYWYGTSSSIKNYPTSHPVGSKVEEYYAWMYKESDSEGNWRWISHPINYGLFNKDNDFVNDCDEQGRWALRIETVDDELHSNFLHVLHPTVDMGETQMAETTLIETGNMKGALIKDPSNLRIVMFSPDTSQVSSVTYDADYLSSQTGKHLITGLIPNVNYKIYKNGVEIDSQVSSDQGTVYFESTGGSTFSLSTAALEDCESIAGACKDDPCSAYTDCTSLAGICSAGYCCQGSCEAASSCESGADEDNSGDVSMVEVVDFIEDWKSGSITIAQVLEAIGEWKDGC